MHVHPVCVCSQYFIWLVAGNIISTCDTYVPMARRPIMHSTNNGDYEREVRTLNKILIAEGSAEHIGT